MKNTILKTVLRGMWSGIEWGRAADHHSCTHSGSDTCPCPICPLYFRAHRHRSNLYGL